MMARDAVPGGDGTVELTSRSRRADLLDLAVRQLRCGMALAGLQPALGARVRQIRARGAGKEVRWPYAELRVAAMADEVSGRDRAIRELVANPVGQLEPVARVEHPVAAAALRAGPDPARAGFVDKRPEALFNRLRRSRFNPAIRRPNHA